MMAGTFAALVGFLFLPALLAGAILLYRVKRTSETLLLSFSLVVAILGRLIQYFSPFEPSYVTDSAGAVAGAMGTFPPVWYWGSIVASLGYGLAALCFVLYSLSEKTAKNA